MKWFLSISLGFLLLAGACFLYFKKHSSDEIQKATVKRGIIIESVYGIGSVKARRTYTLKVGVTSSVQALFVQEGDFVQTGQKLLTLPDVQTFKAPFSGVITGLNYELSETIFPQAPILVLTDFKNPYLFVSLEQTGALKVQKGQKAMLNFEGFREKSFSGIVQSVYSNTDRLLVRINPEELPKSILPGMSADVSIVVGEHTNALLVPAAAITLGKVTLVNGHQVEIKTGVFDGETAEIVSSDLKEGDEVLIHAATRD